jgi:hypothetical protein
VTTVTWRGLDEPRMELARVQLDGTLVRAAGTQIGVGYELQYALELFVLRVEIVGDRRVEVPLDGADFFDLGNSPLFNSLPVMRDGLLVGGLPHDYSMRWVSVPELEVSKQRQRYAPLPDNVVRFTSGDFVADIRFGKDGLVDYYPGLAERVA